MLAPFSRTVLVVVMVVGTVIVVMVVGTVIVVMVVGTVIVVMVVVSASALICCCYGCWHWYCHCLPLPCFNDGSASTGLVKSWNTCKFKDSCEVHKDF